VFVGFVGTLTTVLLARWASLWVEHWTYVNHWPTAWPVLVTAALALVLLLLWVRLFTSERMQRYVQVLESAGWFSATSYKSNQGQKVRRGTIFGILLLVGAGIYTMLSHNVLGRTAPEWALDVPFTGASAVEYYGDARGFIADLPAEQKNRVMITWAGIGTSFHTGKVVSLDKYREEVLGALKSAQADEPDRAAALEKELPKADADPTDYLLAVNKLVFGPALKRMLDGNFYKNETVTRRMEVLYNETAWEDIGDVVAAFYREANTDQRAHLPAEFHVPAAVLVLDRFVMRDVNEKTDEQHNVKVVFKGDWDEVKEGGKVKYPVKEGGIVPRSQFDEVVGELEQMNKKRGENYYALPRKETLTAAWGQPRYSSITLLPSLQFTVPLLLLAGSLWLAWRVVNMPTFADFLIATEAELNKVSWTTQRKLIQDTIVVLVTVVLMGVFLFGMDLAWKQVLSWRPVGVLYIPPPDETTKNQKMEAKRW